MPGERQPFPPWLRELCYFIGLALMLAGGYYGLKGDQRSTQETVARLSVDLSNTTDKIDKMSDRLPNREADAIRFRVLEEKVDKNKADLDFEIAKLIKFKEETSLLLVKKGID